MGNDISYSFHASEKDRLYKQGKEDALKELEESDDESRVLAEKCPDKKSLIIARKDWVRGRHIAGGASAQVYEGILKNNGTPVVIKTVPMEILKEANSIQLNHLLHELQVVKQITGQGNKQCHPSLMSLITH